MNCKFAELKEKTDDGNRQVKCDYCGHVVVTPTPVDLIHRACDLDKPPPKKPAAEEHAKK